MIDPPPGSERVPPGCWVRPSAWSRSATTSSYSPSRRLGNTLIATMVSAPSPKVLTVIRAGSVGTPATNPRMPRPVTGSERSVTLESLIVSMLKWL